MTDAPQPRHDHIAFGLTRSPSFFKQLQFRNPTDSRETVFSHAFHTGRDLDYFEWMAANPDEGAIFNSAMGALEIFGLMTIGRNLDLKRILHLDSEGRPSTSLDDNGVLIVDVGGGKGHVLKSIVDSHPGLRGRLILQDLPNVLPSKEELKDYPMIETMAQDFFTPQPELGMHKRHLLSSMNT